MQDIIFKLSYPTAGLDTPLGLQELEAPKPTRQSAHEGGKGWQLYAPAAFTPRKYSWYSFLLEAELTPGHSAAGRIKSMKNPNDHIETRNHDLPACSAVPQPTAPPHTSLPVFKTKSGRNL